MWNDNRGHDTLDSLLKNGFPTPSDKSYDGPPIPEGLRRTRVMMAGWLRLESTTGFFGNFPDMKAPTHQNGGGDPKRNALLADLLR